MKILLRKISILILTYHRPEDLNRCLESLATAICSYEKQIIVVVNGSCEQTEQLLKHHSEVEIIRCDNLSPAEARNIGLAQATGDFVVFLDDDACVRSDYFVQAQQALEKNPDVQVLGGPDSTFPDAGAKEQSIGMALQSPFVTGPTCLRHGGMNRNQSTRRASESSLILCNLWVRRTIFTDKGHLFDKRFWRNEENVLLHQLRREKMLYVPQLKVHHRRKKDLSHLYKANFRSGYYRVKSIFMFPESFKLVFSFPMLLLLVTLCLPLLPSSFVLMYLGYWLGSFFFSGYLTLSQGKIHLWPWVFFYQVVVVFAYGWGFLSSLLAACGTLFSKKVQRTFKLLLGSGLN